MENLRCAVDDYMEATLAGAFHEQQKGMGRTDTVMNVAIMQARVEAKFKRILLYFKSDSVHLVNLQTHLHDMKNSAQAGTPDVVRASQQKLLDLTREILHEEWLDIRKKMNMDEYYKFDNLVGI
jgi:hypothetical protein